MIIGGVVFGAISIILFVIFMAEYYNGRILIGFLLSSVLCLSCIFGHIYRVNHADMSKVYRTIDSIDHGNTLTIKIVECIYIPYDFDSCETIDTRSVTYDTDVDRIKIIQGVK